MSRRFGGAQDGRERPKAHLGNRGAASGRASPKGETPEEPARGPVLADVLADVQKLESGPR